MADFSFVPSCPGDPIRIDYNPIVQADGTIVLEPAGKFDLQEWYDSQAPGCDLHLIVSRYLAGDHDVLSRVQGSYFDARGLPGTYAEMLQRVIDGERAFDGLPADVKSQFGNDFRQWFAQAGSDDWYSKMGIDLTVHDSPALDRGDGDAVG